MNRKTFVSFAAAVLMFAVCGCATIQENRSMEKPSTITDVHDFLKKTQTYYLATIDGDQPRVRPFGTVMLYEGKLYIQTGKKKNVSKQIGRNGKVELCAFDGDRWLRLSGTLVEDERRAPKAAMLDAYPGLKKMYSPDDGNTQVLYFKDATATFNSFHGEPATVKF